MQKTVDRLTKEKRKRPPLAQTARRVTQQEQQRQLQAMQGKSPLCSHCSNLHPLTRILCYYQIQDPSRQELRFSTPNQSLLFLAGARRSADEHQLVKTNRLHTPEHP